MQDQMPQDQPPPQPPKNHSPFSLIKKIILSVFALICFLGLIQVAIQNLFPSTPATPKPSTQSLAPVSYTDQKNKYTTSYPGILYVAKTTYTLALNRQQNQQAAYPLLYISVIPDDFNKSTNEIYNYLPPDMINKIFQAQDNATIQTEQGPDSQYWTFKKIATLQISGTNAVMLQNNNVWQAEGLTNRRLFLKKSGRTYIIGSYYRSQEELNLFRDFVMNFKLIP